MKTLEEYSGMATAGVIIAITLLLWELGVRVTHLPVYLLPAPSAILATLAANPGEYSLASLITLSEAALGLLLGLSAGIAAAVLLGLVPRLEQGVMTLAILIKSTPMVAIAPLLTIWLGFGMFPKILITALLTFFPVLVNSLSGLRSADIAMIETFQAWDASPFEIFWHVRMPASLPYLFAALKVSAPLALVGAVVAEWTGASGGLGRIMWLAYSNLNLPYLFGAVFILAVTGVALYGLINWLEDKIVFWKMK